MINPAGKRC